MAPSIGLNLRVTGYKHQGGRKYMEDEFGVAYQQTADEKDLEYAFFGILTDTEEEKLRYLQK